MPFQKEHLICTHYNWSGVNNALSYTGSPSRRLFNPDDGHQVLFIINLFESMRTSFTLNDVHRLEELIKQQLPMEVKSEISVINWLTQTSKS